MKISRVPSHEELRGAVPEVKDLLDTNLCKWKVPLTHGDPSSVQMLPQSQYKRHHTFSEENGSILLINSNCEKILICVCINCGSLCHVSCPSLQIFQDSHMFICLLNFPFRLKIETSHPGIKKRREKEYRKGCPKTEHKKLTEDVFWFNNTYLSPLCLFFLLLNSDYQVVPAGSLKSLIFLYYR